MKNLLKRFLVATLFGFLVAGVGFAAIPHKADAAVHVNGYFRKNGTYVNSYYRSSPDGNPYNNYSFPGNYNPYTGKTATGNANTYLYNYYKKSPSSSSYISPYSGYIIPTYKPSSYVAPDYSYLSNSYPSSYSNYPYAYTVPTIVQTTAYTAPSLTSTSPVPANAMYDESTSQGWKCYVRYIQVGGTCVAQ